MAADSWSEIGPSGHATDVELGSELAAFGLVCAIAANRGDDWAVVLSALPAHPVAVLASEFDDLLVASLNAQTDGGWPL